MAFTHTHAHTHTYTHTACALCLLPLAPLSFPCLSCCCCCRRERAALAAGDGGVLDSAAVADLFAGGTAGAPHSTDATSDASERMRAEGLDLQHNMLDESRKVEEYEKLNRISGGCVVECNVCKEKSVCLCLCVWRGRRNACASGTLPGLHCRLCTCVHAVAKALLALSHIHAHSQPRPVLLS